MFRQPQRCLGTKQMGTKQLIDSPPVLRHPDPKLMNLQSETLGVLPVVREPANRQIYSARGSTLKALSMRHPFVEASARLLLVLVFGTCSSAQVTKPSTREGDLNGSSAADGFQFQRAYVSSFGKEPPHHRPTGYVSGTIFDQSGAVNAGAEVLLSDVDQASNKEVESGSNGQFRFTNVAPGPFRLTVTSPGFATRVITADLRPGETYLVPPIILTVATSVIEVLVKESPLTQVQMADMQIKEQEKQRVLGVFPNFYVSYGRDALPLNSRQKFRLAWKTTRIPSPSWALLR